MEIRLQFPGKLRTSAHIQIASVAKQNALSVLTSEEDVRGSVPF